MKKKLLYILSILTLFFVLPSCNNEGIEEVEAEGIPVVIRLGLSSRADGDIAISDGTGIANLKIWMVKEGQQKASFYQNITNPTFTNGIYTMNARVDLFNEGSFSFYVLANSSSISPDSYSSETTVDELRTAYFTQIVGATAGTSPDVPMYGEYHSLNIKSSVREYSVTVPIERMLSKIELYFAKKTDNFTLKVNSARLSQVPEKGFIAPQANLATILGTFPNLARTIDLGATTIEDVENNSEKQIYVTNQIEENYFADREAYTSLPLSAPFIFENPHGNGQWHVTATQGHANGYQLTINYTIGQTIYDQVLYLPEVKRNMIDKIYCLIDEKNKNSQFKLVPMPWEKLEDELNFTDVPTYSVTGWKSGSYQTITDNVVLLNNASNGTAFITFSLEGPVGATWEAVLTNDMGQNFELVGDTSGNVGEGKTISLGVKAKDWESETTCTAELHVYLHIGDKSLEIDMTKEKNDAKLSGDIEFYTIKHSY